MITVSHAIVLVDSDRRLSHITTATCPGVLLPVANRPLLSYVIEFLEGSGVSNVVLIGSEDNVVNEVDHWCRSEYAGKCTVETVCDPTSRKSTVKLLRHVLPNIGGCENVVVLNGDFIADFGLSAQILMHEVKQAALTMLISKQAEAALDGLGSSGSKLPLKRLQATDFIAMEGDTVAMYAHAHDKMRDMKISEACLCKHTSLNVRKDLSDMGVYIFRAENLKSVLHANPGLLDIQKHLIPYMVRYQIVKSANQSGSSRSTLERTSSTNLAASGSHPLMTGQLLGSTTKSDRCGVNGYQVPEGHYCSRVRDTEMYAEVNRDVMSSDLAGRFITQKPTSRGDAYIHESVICGNKVTIGAFSMVGDASQVGDKCSVKRSVIGSHCILGSSSKIINSVIQDSVVLGDGCHVQNSIICTGAKLGAKVTLKDCQVGPGAVLPESSDYKSEQVLAE